MTTSLAPNETDSTVLDALTQHRAEMVGTVVAHATALLDASSAGSLEGASTSRRDLVLFCRGEMLPYTIAAEDSLYAQARRLPQLGALVDSLTADHRALAELIDDLAGATTPLGASVAGHALRVLFELHIEKENDYLLPAMAASDEVSLADAVTALTTLADELSAAAQGGGCGGGCGCGSGGCGGGAAQSEPAGGGCGCGGGGCGCGGHDAAPETGAATSARPVLDARQVPHHIRHATVFGALDAVRPGAGLELIAPHDPLPLLAQVDERDPGAFEVSYLERGPEVWRIALDRRASVEV